MNFVEGGQLDEVVRREPMSIRQAAELIAKVARTVHYAHEHGILHRDIKPGNILLDQKANRILPTLVLRDWSKQRAPSRARWKCWAHPVTWRRNKQSVKRQNSASATDVYGLGAVLYQLLTGQPPFAGGTTYETIKLLLETEPRPPRLLNPKVDRDLSHDLPEVSGERSKAPLLFRSGAGRRLGTLAKARADPREAQVDFSHTPANGCDEIQARLC